MVDDSFYELLFRHQQLCIYLDNNIPIIISGPIEIKYLEKLYGIFECKIILDKYFPKSFPKVFELSQLIPSVPYRHVNTDGSLCLCVEAMKILAINGNFGILEYFDEFLIPYLATQICYEGNGKKYIGGEYAHCIEGELEFFKEKLDLISVSDAKNYIKIYLKSKANFNVKELKNLVVMSKKLMKENIQFLNQFPTAYLILLTESK